MSDRKKRKSKPKKKKVLVAVDMASIGLLENKEWTGSLKKHVKFKPVNELTGHASAEDLEVYNTCNNAGYHVLTANVKDFRCCPKKSSDSGIIGHDHFMSEKAQENLKELLSNKGHGHDFFYGKTIYVNDDGYPIKRDVADRS